MAKLLISVQNRDEAEAALDGGCNLLDIKQPHRGSLGMADLPEISQILSCVDSYRSSPQAQISHCSPLYTSVALGELHDWQTRQLTAAEADLNRANYLKVGAAGITSAAEWLRLWSELRTRFAQAGIVRPQWIAAFYADAATTPTGEWDELTDLSKSDLSQPGTSNSDTFNSAPAQLRLPWMFEPLSAAPWQAAVQQSGCVGVLLDTQYKQGPSLSQLLTLFPKSPFQLCKNLTEWKQSGLLTALAGRLTCSEITGLLRAGIVPDYFAVRSAVCLNGNRLAAVDSQQVRDLAQLLSHS